jgi:hypothetical protein
LNEKNALIETNSENVASRKTLAHVLEKFAQFSPDFMDFGRGVNLQKERNFDDWSED